MSYHSILEYIKSLSRIYFKASKSEKSALLSHAVKVTGYNRKSLIRKLKNNRAGYNKKRRCGAKVKYPHDLLFPHIQFLWNAMGRISAKRMKAAYTDWLPYYKENEVNNHIKYLLQKMSVTTLGRFLKFARRLEQKKYKGLCSTSPARHMLNKVPINTLDSTITRIGYFQADTVAHCGTKLIGDFINSITLTDIQSTWTVNRAVFTKKGTLVRPAINHMMKIMPFEIKAINTDSGSEFLNFPIFNDWTSKKIIFTRSRPYKKNDNCYVEQKNSTHVRDLFGYQRFDDQDLVKLMNNIYEFYWNPYQNFFIPTFKLKEKTRVGARIVKKYDAPKTPYQRLMESSHMSEKDKRKLSEQKKSFNPFELKTQLEEKLDHFFNAVQTLERLKREAS